MSRMIQISELTFATRDRRRILENLYLSVERGEVVGIVGPTNAGKSLLMALIQGVAKPLSGQILVNDRNVTRLSPGKLKLLRQNLGVMPQHPVWPEQLNLEECIQFKLSWMGLTPRQINRKTDEVVQHLALGNLRAQRFTELSECDQLVGYLALSLCHDPVLLLCDGLFDRSVENDENALSLMLNQVQQQRNLTVLLTAQSPDSLSGIANRIVHLEGGALREAHTE